jgi:protein-ribulosamine 3-kinase
MAYGELEGTRELYALIPDNVPRPIGAGPLSSSPEKHFFLAEFCDMMDELPATPDFVAALAKVHQKKSPNGKFGFACTTFHGNLPMDNAWCDTWEEYFTRVMKESFRFEREVQGADEEMDKLAEQLITKVIPRLLRPMETNGRHVEPVLLHGDLWHGNVGTNNNTDDPVLYDPCVLYGHNECKLGCIWFESYTDLCTSRVSYVQSGKIPNQSSSYQSIPQARRYDSSR